MADEFDDSDAHLGLDASGLISGLDDVNTAFKEQIRIAQQTADTFFKLSEAGDDLAFRLNSVDEAGNKFNFTFKKVEEVVKLASQSVTLATQQITSGIESNVSELDSLIARIDEVNRKKSLQNVAQQTVRRNQSQDPEQIEADYTAQLAKQSESFEVGYEKFLRVQRTEFDKELAQAEKQRLDEEKQYTALLDRHYKEQDKLDQLNKSREAQLLAGITQTQNKKDAADQAQLAKDDAVFQRHLAAEQRQYDKMLAQYTREQEGLYEARRRAQAALSQELNTARSGSDAQRLRDLGGVPPNTPNIGLPSGGGGEDQVRRLSQSFNEVESSGTRAGNSILLSWQSVFRLFSIQVLHTALRSFIADIEQALTTVQQFEIKISEIRTISQDSGLSFTQWSDAARKLSDEFGNPILDVTAGIYETISNQIAKGADATTFLTTAQKFAATTASTLEQSVNLLSSAINSYGLRTNEADRVAAGFFKTIDLGRVRAEDIANTFGRTGPIAHQLGVSMEEVEAAIATLTIKGVPANETFVLINNVLTHLIKPTKDMSEAFKELGVESGEQAVRTFGVIGVLQKLEEVTRGSSSAIADLFKDIRAIRGATGLSGISNDDFQKNLDQIKNSLPEYQRAIGIAFESPGKELQIQLNKIHNWVLHDFADPVVAGIVGIGKAVSGEGLFGAFKGTLELITVSVGVYISYKTALAAVNIYTKAQNTEMATAILLKQQETIRTTALADAELLEARASQVAAAGKLELSAALNASAAAYIREAEAQEIAMAEAAAASTALGRVGSTLLGFVSNPALWLTGIIAAIGYATVEYGIFGEAADAAFKKAVESQKEANVKIIEEAEKNRSEVHKIFEDKLNQDFASYSAYGARVNQFLKDSEQSEIEHLNEITEIRKIALSTYIKEYDDATNQIVAKEKQYAIDVRRIEEQLSSEKERFAETAFQRELRNAQHLDAMASPSGAKLFNSNEVALVNAELDRLALKKQNLLDLTGKDSDQIKQNVSDAAKVTQQQIALDTNLGDKRNRLEDQHLSTTKEIEKIKAQILEHERQSSFEAKDTLIKNDIASQKALENQRKLQSPTIKALLDEKTQNSASSRQDKDSFNLDKERESLRILEAKSKSEENSLNNLPTRNQLEERFVELQRQSVDLLEQAKQKTQELHDVEAYEAEIRKEDFEKLRGTLSEISKVKFDKPEIKTQGELDSQIQKFDALTKKAIDFGLQDQNLIAKLYDEEEQMRRAGNTRILELQKSADLALLNQTKAAAQRQFDESQNALKAREGPILKLLEIAAPILGKQGADQFSAEAGTLRQVQFDSISAGLDRVHIEQSTFNRNLDNTQKAFFDLQAALNRSIKEGTEVPISQIQFFDKNLSILEQAIIRNPKLADTPIQGGTIKDSQGNIRTDLTFGSQLADLRQFSVSLKSSLDERSPFIVKIKEANDAFAVVSEGMNKVTSSSDDVKKSFTELAEETKRLVQGFHNAMPFGPTDNSLTPSNTPFGPVPSEGFIPQFSSNTDNSPEEGELNTRLRTSSPNALFPKISLPYEPFSAEKEFDYFNFPLLAGGSNQDNQFFGANASGSAGFTPTFNSGITNAPTESTGIGAFTIGAINLTVNAGDQNVDGPMLFKQLQRVIREQGKGLIGNTAD